MGPRLVIIGGGYVGSEVARRLDAEMNVSLIEARDAFVHAPAMIRALVEPGLTDQAILPYERLLKRGHVIRQRATEIRRDGVWLANGDFMAADLILVATGSGYAAPFKPQGDSIEMFRQTQADISDRISAARHISIVGGGPVGIELAGEIAAALPGSSVSLIAADTQLMQNFPARFGCSLEAKLASLGVSVIKGSRANLMRGTAPLTGQLVLENGRTIEADLILPATGARGRNELVACLPGARSTACGRVQADPWLRPTAWPNLFIGGDVAHTGDAMTIVAAMRQIPYIVKLLRRASRGKEIEQQRPYRPWKYAPILMPLGPRIGSSVLPVPQIFASLGVVGNIATRQLKGRDLFLPKYRRLFGLA